MTDRPTSSSRGGRPAVLVAPTLKAGAFPPDITFHSRAPRNTFLVCYDTNLPPNAARAFKFPRTRVRGLIDAYSGEEKSASEERNGIACRGAESCQVSAR